MTFAQPSSESAFVDSRYDAMVSMARFGRAFLFAAKLAVLVVEYIGSEERGAAWSVHIGECVLHGLLLWLERRARSLLACGVGWRLALGVRSISGVVTVECKGDGMRTLNRNS